MKKVIEQEIHGLLHAAGVEGEIELSTPPSREMGDLSFACFAVAKEQGENPVAMAQAIADAIEIGGFVQEVKTAGPYVNFYLDLKEVATALLKEISSEHNYGSHQIGAKKKYIVEYACPNPLKAFHLGHLKNLITGEAVARTFENAGYTIIRTNYQGDVGMHIAKALWGIYDQLDEFEQMKTEPEIKTRVEFLGAAYARGAQRYDESDEGKEEVIAYNDKVYAEDESIQSVYQLARQWSLDYFDLIYKRLGTQFDHFYFESGMFKEAVTLVEKGKEAGIFVQGDGAIIYEGSKHGLHDRVFINSKGFPTYEAKDLALARQHIDDHNPDKIVHVVGKEQTEYFKVVFAAMEELLPQTKGKEAHLIGGFLQLKGAEKMSSRTGRIVTGDALLFLVEERVREVMAESEVEDMDEVVERVTAAALKYAMLRADVSKDVAFDMEESISLSGDSGPYLLYIVARINSIMKKGGELSLESDIVIPATLDKTEESLLLQLAQYPVVTQKAVEEMDPSHITRYLFELAQSFNSFYTACPVLQQDEVVQAFRLRLVAAVKQVMAHGLDILGIQTVEQM